MSDPFHLLAMTFPLTHFFHFQGQEWILNAPLTSSLYTLGKLAIFALLWFGVGFALFKKRIAQEVAGENEVRS